MLSAFTCYSGGPVSGTSGTHENSRGFMWRELPAWICSLGPSLWLMLGYGPVTALTYPGEKRQVFATKDVTQKVEKDDQLKNEPGNSPVNQWLGLCSHCWSPTSISGTKILQAVCCGRVGRTKWCRSLLVQLLAFTCFLLFNDPGSKIPGPVLAANKDQRNWKVFLWIPISASVKVCQSDQSRTTLSSPRFTLTPGCATGQGSGGVWSSHSSPQVVSVYLPLSGRLTHQSIQPAHLVAVTFRLKHPNSREYSR